MSNTIHNCMICEEELVFIEDAGGPLHRAIARKSDGTQVRMLDAIFGCNNGHQERMAIHVDPRDKRASLEILGDS